MSWFCCYRYYRCRDFILLPGDAQHCYFRTLHAWRHWFDHQRNSSVPYQRHLFNGAPVLYTDSEMLAYAVSAIVSMYISIYIYNVFIYVHTMIGFYINWKLGRHSRDVNLYVRFFGLVWFEGLSWIHGTDQVPSYNNSSYNLYITQCNIIIHFIFLHNFFFFLYMFDTLILPDILRWRYLCDMMTSFKLNERVCAPRIYRFLLFPSLWCVCVCVFFRVYNCKHILNRCIFRLYIYTFSPNSYIYRDFYVFIESVK